MVFKLVKRAVKLPGKSGRYSAVASAVLLAALFTVTSVESQTYYRYKNSQGTVVIDQSVPPEYVAGGYEVLNQSGTVIEVVPPHQPVDEGAAIVQQNSNKDQQREDSMLLRSYSSIEEIEAARERRLSLLKREVDIVAGNEEKSRRMLDASRSRAANLQTSGKPVPESLLKHIDDLGAQIDENVELRRVRQQEYQAVSDKYEYYIRRFAELKGLNSGQPQPESQAAAAESAADQFSAQEQSPTSSATEEPDPVSEKNLP